MSRFTAAQKTEILTQARRNIAGAASPAASPKLNGLQTKYIEQDVASSQEQIIALRGDVTELRAQFETLSRVVSGLAQEIDDTRSFTKNLPAVQAPQAGGVVVWWEWVNARFEEFAEELHEDVGTALGELVGKVRDELEERTGAVKRELELQRREFGVLKNEVGLERELKDLRSQVVKAQRSVPQVPAIEARLRSEATIAKVGTDQEIGELRKALKQTQRSLVSLQVKQAHVSRDLKRGQDEELEVEWEASSGRARMVVRPSMHPDAAKTLREFAAQVIDETIVH